MKYRIYIDEVGNSDLNASTDSNHRYLSLAGVIFELDYVSSAVFPAVESLKARYFASHPDDPVILHRKELVNKKPPFAALQEDQAIEQAFNRELCLGLSVWLAEVAESPTLVFQCNPGSPASCGRSSTRRSRTDNSVKGVVPKRCGSRFLRNSNTIVATTDKLTDGVGNGFPKRKGPEGPRRLSPSTSSNLDYLYCIVDHR